MLLTDLVDDVWTYRRDPRVRRTAVELWDVHDGIRFLRPEIQLLHKAPGRRPCDEADLAAALPLLDDQQRRWLRTALDTAHPGHPWADLL